MAQSLALQMMSYELSRIAAQSQALQRCDVSHILSQLLSLVTSSAQQTNNVM